MNGQMYVDGIYHGYCNYTCDCRPAEPFTAWTNCPVCGSFGVHWIETWSKKFGPLRRCRNLNCQFLWRTR